MSAKNTTKVLIDGKIITLSGYESEEYLQKVASYLNNKIAELSQIPGYKRQRPETKNTLLSLNVADDYFKAKNMAESLEEDIEVKDSSEAEEVEEIINKELTEEIEEDIEVKDKENYDMKHDLIAAQIQLEKTNHEIEKLKKEKDELNGKVRELSDELEEFLKQ